MEVTASARKVLLPPPEESEGSLFKESVLETVRSFVLKSFCFVEVLSTPTLFLYQVMVCCEDTGDLIGSKVSAMPAPFTPSSILLCLSAQGFRQSRVLCSSARFCKCATEQPHLQVHQVSPPTFGCRVPGKCLGHLFVSAHLPAKTPMS